MSKNDFKKPKTLTSDWPWDAVPIGIEGQGKFSVVCVSDEAVSIAAQILLTKTEIYSLKKNEKSIRKRQTRKCKFLRGQKTWKGVAQKIDIKMTHQLSQTLKIVKPRVSSSIYTPFRSFSSFFQLEKILTNTWYSLFILVHFLIKTLIL